MKKILISLITLFSSFVYINTVEASHFAGAELSYINIGGFSYKVTLNMYRDCNGITVPNNEEIECSIIKK